MQQETLSLPKLMLYLLYLLLFYALQSSLFGTWAVRGFHLDLLPCFAVAAGLLDGPAEGAVVGIGVGILYDLGMNGIDGVYPIFFLLCGVLAGVLCQLTLSRNYASMLLLTAAEMLVLGLGRYFFFLLPQQGASFALVLQQVLGGTLLACVLCFAVYLPLRAINRRFHPQR